MNVDSISVNPPSSPASSSSRPYLFTRYDATVKASALRAVLNRLARNADNLVEREWLLECAADANLLYERLKSGKAGIR